MGRIMLVNITKVYGVTSLGGWQLRFIERGKEKE
jgi:hypothetical protein